MFELSNYKSTAVNWSLLLFLHLVSVIELEAS